MNSLFRSRGLFPLKEKLRSTFRFESLNTFRFFFVHKNKNHLLKKGHTDKAKYLCNMYYFWMVDLYPLILVPN